MTNQRNPQIEIPTQRSTSDIWFVVFLVYYKNKQIASWTRKDRGRAIFHFTDITDEEWAHAKKEFNYESQISTIKYQIEQVKDLIH